MCGGPLTRPKRLPPLPLRCPPRAASSARQHQHPPRPSHKPPPLGLLAMQPSRRPWLLPLSLPKGDWSSSEAVRGIQVLSSIRGRGPSSSKGGDFLLRAAPSHRPYPCPYTCSLLPYLPFPNPICTDTSFQHCHGGICYHSDRLPSVVDTGVDIGRVRPLQAGKGEGRKESGFHTMGGDSTHPSHKMRGFIPHNGIPHPQPLAPPAAALRAVSDDRPVRQDALRCFRSGPVTSSWRRGR